jgi:hypothetical protein
MTFAGKNVVALNLALEQTPSHMQEGVIDFYMLFEPFQMIGITLYYQHIANHWFPIQLLHLVIIVVSTLFILVCVPESPKFLHSKGLYKESKESLE